MNDKRETYRIPRIGAIYTRLVEKPDYKGRACGKNIRIHRVFYNVVDTNNHRDYHRVVHYVNYEPMDEDRLPLEYEMKIDTLHDLYTLDIQDEV